VLANYQPYYGHRFPSVAIPANDSRRFEAERIRTPARWVRVFCLPSIISRIIVLIQFTLFHLLYPNKCFSTASGHFWALSTAQPHCQDEVDFGAGFLLLNLIGRHVRKLYKAFGFGPLQRNYRPLSWAGFK
jgi:hypothetical protein